MDSSIWVIILFAIMAILSDKLGKKKTPKRMPPFPPRDVDRTLPPPMPEPWGKAERGEKNVPFEIPDIKGAPLPQGMTDEGGIYREPGTKMQDMLEAYREEMADKFPWSAKGRVIVFAPTFRGTGQRTAYYPYDEIDMDRLYRMCVETDTYFVFEMHHFIRKRPDISAEYADRIFDLSDESLTKLFFIADVLVTDYSSCFYDYLLLKKPVVFFVPDKTAYSLIRGVQRSIDEMAPGVVCDTFDEFLDVLRTRHYETVSPHPSSIDRAAERSGLASDRAIDTIIYGKDVPGVRKQASGKGGAVPVRQSDKSAKSERKAKELLDSKVADKDTKSASDEEE